MNGSAVQSSSRASVTDYLQYLPLNGQAVQLSPPQFFDKILQPDVDVEDFSALASSASPLYRTFVDNCADAGSSFQQDALVLLNSLSNEYQVHLGLNPKEHMKFVDISRTELSQHPDGASVKPQLIATSERVMKSWTNACAASSLHKSIAYHNVAAGVFVHDQETTSDSSSDFLWTLLKARPDFSGAVVASLSQQSCEFVYADRAAAYTSGRMEWGKSITRFLLGFIHLVHTPFVDPTVTLERKPLPPQPTKRNIRYCAKPWHVRAPVWLVRNSCNYEYRVTEVLAVGEPLGNGNWVGAATQRRSVGPRPSSFEDYPRTVIKDFWSMTAQERSAEDAILKHVHAESPMPGVCELIDAFLVPAALVPEERGVLRTRSIDNHIPLRRKHRMVLDGTSTNIYTCTSVLEFLMVSYDLLETLKMLHERRRVTYRDVSFGNVRCHARGGTSVNGSTTFVGDVLVHKYADSRLRSGPSCTIIDFDHSFSADHMDAWSLEHAVGTPPYVARAVVQEFSSVDPSPPPPFPQLCGQARDCFIQAHGIEGYNSSSNLRPSPYGSPRPIPPEYRLSRPVHDAESCFWFILHFFVTSLPKRSSDTDETTIGDNICRTIEATDFGIPDGRSCLFEQRDIWSKCLHPGLQDFSDLLGDLAEQVRPSYEAWGHVNDEYHLHRAMQMILLQEICRILDEGVDVPLDTEYRRVGSEGPFHEPVTVQGKKRRGGSIALPEAQRMRMDN